MAEHCPTCGGVVELVASDEGTSYFAPAGLLAEAERRLLAIYDLAADWPPKESPTPPSPRTRRRDTR